MSVEVVSDVVCPWCFIGHRSLSAALDLVPDVEVAIDWQPYQLHPYLPREGVDYKEHYARKFRGNAAPLVARVKDAGRSVGIDFRFDKIERVPNSLSAHAVIGWAKPGLERNQIVERLFEAYFLEGQDVGDVQVLGSLAAEVGMDGSEIEARLRRDEDRAEVASTADNNRREGITGVPFFKFGDQYPVMGAQNPDTLAKVIERTLAARA